MLVIVYVETVPQHLRGYLDRYLNEIRSSLFVGSLASTVTDELWQTILAEAGDGDVVMITPSHTEAGFNITHRPRPNWKIVDHHGWPLPARRSGAQESTREGIVAVQ